MLMCLESPFGVYALRPFLASVSAIPSEPLEPDMATALKRNNKIKRGHDCIAAHPEKEPTQKWLGGARSAGR
jgi:hypothetical protein